MASLVGAVVVIFIVVAFVVGVAVVVVRMSMTSGWLLSVTIVTILAMHIVTNNTNQMIIL